MHQLQGQSHDGPVTPQPLLPLSPLQSYYATLIACSHKPARPAKAKPKASQMRTRARNMGMRTAAQALLPQNLTGRRPNTRGGMGIVYVLRLERLYHMSPVDTWCDTRDAFHGCSLGPVGIHPCS